MGRKAMGKSARFFKTAYGETEPARVEAVGDVDDAVLKSARFEGDDDVKDMDRRDHSMARGYGSY